MPDAQVGDRCPMDHDGKAPELVVYALVAPGIAAGIHAAGVQEGRAAMLSEVVESLRSDEDYEYDRVADAIEARFPSEGTT